MENVYENKDTGNLVTVGDYEGNLHIKSSFEYQLTYIEDGDINYEIIWRNIRMICGLDIWYH